jgi:hypothetical protein
LAAFTDRPRVGARLRRLPFILSARGDLEVVVTFCINHADAVCAVLKPYRRRRLSPAQRAKNAETLARARQKHREFLTRNDFRAPGSTHDARNSLQHPQPEDRSAVAEVRPSQGRGARPRTQHPAGAR